MSVLNISAAAGDNPLEPRAMEALRKDLEQEVGPVALPAATAAGAKGAVLGSLAALAVTILTPQAVVALIGIVRSHLERGREYEIELSGPGGTLKLKGADARRLGESEFANIVQQLLRQPEGGESNAPSHPGRV